MKISTKISAIALLATPFMAQAQNAIFYSNGATVAVTSSSSTVMTVNGKLSLNNASQFTNDGQIEVKNSPLNTGTNSIFGDFEIIDALSNSQGNGKYIVEQDWNNNGVFTANNSDVIMPTGTQKIKGSQITTFHNLSFTSATGTNQQEQHAKVNATGTFALNSVELATQGYYMEILNPSTSAIIFLPNSGFVSSTGKGKLFRATNSNTISYTYPVGVAGTYRPIEMLPSSTTPSEYGVAFVNNNATVDGFNLTTNDSGNCKLNDKFYHRINKVGSSVDATVTVNYLTVPDGAWTGISHWGFPQASKWNSKGFTDNQGVNAPFATVFRNNYLSFQDSSDHGKDPFVLGIQKPGMPLLVGPVAKCGSEVFLKFIANGVSTTSNYNWVLPAGVTIIGNPLNDTIITNWSAVNSGIVKVSEAFGTCASDSSNYTINSYAAPIAKIDTMNIGTINDVYTFMDSSKVATPEIINNWKWTFTDAEATSALQNPSHLFTKPGEFPVTLIVKTANGCADTAMTKIIIREGIKYSNVFSPNGDGSNDFFVFPNIGLDDDFTLSIYDRWGLLIFETNGKNVGWDGRTLAGKSVTEGTYYYVLQAKSAAATAKPYDSKGTITVMK
ncbi:MAG: gliding motility-associated C-terminal domain-containing protein [Bacteroidia bacterium]|nr:gliding motility-associated C-terminal domain-containing protein [Bacteroidia bacterium]